MGVDIGTPEQVSKLLTYPQGDIMYTILTRSQCNFCDAAKALLHSAGYRFNTINVQHQENAWILKLMLKADLKTVPQIFTPSGELVGGYTELTQRMMDEPE